MGKFCGSAQNSAAHGKPASLLADSKRLPDNETGSHGGITPRITAAELTNSNQCKLSTGGGATAQLSTSGGATAQLEQPAVFEVVLDDDVGDGVHDKLDVARVRGTREVRVDVLGGSTAVQLLELRSDVSSGLIVRVTT